MGQITAKAALLNLVQWLILRTFQELSSTRWAFKAETQRKLSGVPHGAYSRMQTHRETNADRKSNSRSNGLLEQIGARMARTTNEALLDA